MRHDAARPVPVVPDAVRRHRRRPHTGADVTGEHDLTDVELYAAVDEVDRLRPILAAVNAALDDYPLSPSADRSRLFDCVSAIAKAVGR